MSAVEFVKGWLADDVRLANERLEEWAKSRDALRDEALTSEARAAVRREALEEAAKLCDRAASEHYCSSCGLTDEEWIEIPARRALGARLAKQIRELCDK
jgi:hypothetical protein